MANQTATNMTGPYTDWIEFFSREEQKESYGKINELNGIHEEYVDDVKGFTDYFNATPLVKSILFPGGESQVRVLHNCSIDCDRNKVIGVSGTSKFSPFKEITIGAAIKPMVIPTNRGYKADLKIPTVDDFLGCSSGDELVNLVGTGEEPISALEGKPQSFWIHPSLMSTLFDNRITATSKIGESIVLAIEGMEDEEARILIGQHYDMLVFVWAVGKGFTSLNIKFLDLPDDMAHAELVVKTNKLLLGTSPGEPSPTTNRDNRRNRDASHESRTTTSRSSRRGENRSGAAEGRGDLSLSRPRSERSNSSSKSRIRGRGRTRSREHHKTRSRGKKRSRRSRSDSRDGSRRHNDSRSRSSSRFRSRSRSRGRHRDERRTRSPKRARRGTRDDGEEVLAQLTKGVLALASTQHEKLKKDNVEKSVLGKLSERQKDLFSLLSARDWHDAKPSLNRSTEKLLASQNPEKQWNLIEDWSRRWPGLVSKQGAIQFLSTGYASRELPGGFTVFMFSPFRKRATDKKDRKRNIKGTFGKDGELDEEAIDFYASLDYFVPTTLHEAETQLELAVLMLETLTGQQSIATDGYAHGIEIIEKNRLELYGEMEKDKMFMTKFLHFLDVVFNSFCNDLADYHTRSEPIFSAKRKLRGRMKDDIDRVMRDLKHNITPLLPLPSLLTDGETTSEFKNSKPKAEQRESDTTTQKPEWWSRNP
jgi:hypothetical protein